MSTSEEPRGNVTLEYPAQYESDIVLRTGSTLHLRPIRPDDEQELLDLFRRLSPESLHLRFFGARTPEAALAACPPVVDYDQDFGVVGELNARVVAVAHYYRSKTHTDRAEVAFTIDDKFQGCGIGTLLLEKLAHVARQKGVVTFEAEVLDDNLKMMDVFLDSGFDVHRRVADGSAQVVLSLDPTANWEEKSAQRAQTAATASMRSIFEPKSIAVVGASRKRGSIGAELFHNLVASGFQGRLYPVNASSDLVEYIPAYPTVSAIPGPVDLAIVVVPAANVESVIDDCIAKGVKGVVVISAGFSETGDEGRARENRLVEKIRSSGMRMVGPNCMGVLNTSPEVRMHATFSPVYPAAGNVAMSTQSGALGNAILDYARNLNMGFSTFISVGNKADVSGNDLIQYWAEDPNTNVILLYLESFGNPKRFASIARRVGRKKPIVAVKSGRSTAGARAASSHTGALASQDAIVNDLFRQAGTTRVDTLEELFDMAALLSRQPLPLGRRVAILTNAGGPGILAADACEANGLQLSEFQENTMADLRSFLPAEASVGNPVDMIASATPYQYGRAMKDLLDDPNVDALLVIYIPVLPEDVEFVAEAIRGAAKANASKPIIGTFLSARGVPAVLSPVPAFPFPERAVAALARAVGYAEWRRKPVGSVIPFPDLDVDLAKNVVKGALARGGGWLTFDEARDLLRAARIEVARTAIARDLQSALAEAEAIGYPVAMKVAGSKIVHKSDVGGVKLGVDASTAGETFEDLRKRFSGDFEGVIVQEMIAGGVEAMIGSMFDPLFGHLIVYGAGGTLIELLADVAFRITPATDSDVDDMLEQVRFTKLLRGLRGAPPADEQAVKTALMRLSAMLQVCPEIQEMDINPLKVLEDRAVAVDVRVRVDRVQPAKRSRRISY